jgi:NAD(P)-dependent dehydrogenase (short-subunit alcohol dehydrogenase family)
LRLEGGGAQLLRIAAPRDAPYGIRVVTIAPGYIDTPMTSNNRFPMPFLMPAERFAAQPYAPSRPAPASA